VSPWEDVARALSAPDVEQRRRAVSELGEPRGPLPTALLLRALGDEDWRVRKEATTVAASLPASSELLDALMGALATGDNVGLRNAAVDALAGHGVHAVAALAASLRRLDADGRKLVVDSLAKNGRPEGLPILKTLLRDEDANVRGAAIEAIATVGESRAEEAIALLDGCLDAPSRFERLAALEGLNRLIAVLPWERVEPLLDDPILLAPALRAAGRSANEAAVAVIVSKLEAASGRSFFDALAALVELSRASPALRGRVEAMMKAASPELGRRMIELVRDEGVPAEQRRAGLAALSWLSSAEAAFAAVQALGDDALAAEAEATLAELGSVAGPALLEGARGALSEQRAACITLLGPLCSVDADAARAIEAALADEAPEVVAAALDALPNMHTPAALELAARWLVAAPSGLVHQAALRALGLLARRQPEAARGLALRYKPSAREAEASAAILEAITSSSHPSANDDVAYLSEALSSEHPSVRRAALSALSAFGGELVLEPIAFALTDETCDVRQAAVRALGRLRSPDGAPLGLERLHALVSEGADPTLVAAAVRALGEIGSPQSWDTLAALTSAEARVAVAAVEAVAASSDPRRVDVLIGALGHADAEVVKAAVRALATIPDVRVIGELAVCLEHRAWDVRRLVAELLGRIGGDLALTHLRGRLEAETEPHVSDALLRALAEAETSGGRRQTAPPPSLGRRPTT
jgi:HEAT repeat protein